jgi:hypothetical protein
VCFFFFFVDYLGLAKMPFLLVLSDWMGLLQANPE